MPKCVVVDPAVTWGNDIAPRHAWSQSIIYEAHVKGMTALREDLTRASGAPSRGSPILVSSTIS
jgi:pullulanase/glycogen debranching enzyme